MDENLFPDSSSESSEEEEEIIDPEVLRADWEPLIAIPERRFFLALLQHLPEDHGITVDSIRCIEKIKGGFNFVRILEVSTGPYADRYIAKVPSVGTAARWQESDAYMLRNDARTMSFIFKHTTIPSPDVIGFSDSLSSVLTAPYIIMRAKKGIPSNKIWFDRDEDDGGDDMMNAYLVDEKRMAIRLNFLRSLAGQMAKLQNLEFDRAGTLNFDDDPESPTIGPTYHWKTVSELTQLDIDELSTPASINCVRPFKTGYAYFATALDEVWPREDKSKAHIHDGRRHVMECMLAFPPFDESKKVGDKKETFVLRHDDLDF
ncbi:hypothetical protein CC86DRAFT_428985 [Ophiobolus disseminans]|uniref:Aminoglycoside phosphotransferase domain-containing protein n=1 Tax=Ophiobolus disseminans TaxID=1469910 RepID=A0A6A6ZJ29_9PLEO|nr:hypothetical protein CC86DRAFT_428985 [Ophiobolus disseminans]